MPLPCRIDDQAVSGKASRLPPIQVSASATSVSSEGFADSGGGHLNTIGSRIARTEVANLIAGFPPMVHGTSPGRFEGVHAGGIDEQRVEADAPRGPDRDRGRAAFYGGHWDADSNLGLSASPDPGDPRP